MSLESQIAALVQASNELTSAVNGKIGQIDSALAAAINGIPSTIRSTMKVSVWVDATVGSDSNTGQERSKPKRTIKSAVDSYPPGAYISIILMGRQVFEISDDIDGSGKIIILYSDGAVWGDKATRSTIRARQVTSYSDYKSAQINMGWSGEIHLTQVNVETVAWAVGKASYDDYRNSMFSGFSCSSQVWVYGCDIVLNNGPFTHQHPNGSFGKLDLYMNTVNFTISTTPAIPGGNPVIMGNYGSSDIPFTLYAAAVSLPSGKTWNNMITCNKASANTNVTFS